MTAHTIAEVTVDLPPPQVRERAAYVLGGIPMCGVGLASLLYGLVLIIEGKHRRRPRSPSSTVSASCSFCLAFRPWAD